MLIPLHAWHVMVFNVARFNGGAVAARTGGNALGLTQTRWLPPAAILR